MLKEPKRIIAEEPTAQEYSERFDFGLMNGIAGFIYALLSRKVKLPEILLLDI